VAALARTKDKEKRGLLTEEDAKELRRLEKQEKELARIEEQDRKLELLHQFLRDKCEAR